MAKKYVIAKKKKRNKNKYINKKLIFKIYLKRP